MKISEKLKAHDHAVAWQGKSRVPKWTPNAAWTAPVLRVECVGIDGEIDQEQLPKPVGVRVVHGRARGASVHLFIVRTLGYLRELGTTSPSQQVCDLIFVVGMGLPVIGASTWRMAGGDPKKLSPTQVIFHKAASAVKDVVFRYKGDFRMDNTEVMRALEKCTGLPGSKWALQLDKSTPGMPMAAPRKETTELVEITSLASLGDWIIQARVLHKWGCRGWSLRPA